MARLDFAPTPLGGVSVVQRHRVEDARGFLSRLYCADEFAAIGAPKPIAQINHTMTRRRGSVRGMHYQAPPHAEMKVITCLRGEVFDVTVDLRRGSPTFLRWHGEILSASNQRSLIVPEGFAHGFQSMTDECELLYFHTAAFEPSAEGAVNAADPRLAIAWPLEITEMSDRDRRHPMIPATFSGLDL